MSVRDQQYPGVMALTPHACRARFLFTPRLRLKVGLSEPRRISRLAETSQAQHLPLLSPVPDSHIRSPLPLQGLTSFTRRSGNWVAAMDLASQAAGAPVNSAPATASPPEAAGNLAEQRAAPPKPQQVANFCRQCSGRMELVLPEKDHLWRHVCSSCAYVDYQNPKMVTASDLAGPCTFKLHGGYAPERAFLQVQGLMCCQPPSCRWWDASWWLLMRTCLTARPRCDVLTAAYAQVVGCIVEHEGHVLLCKRGIQPQRGFWTVPAGFMEERESSAGKMVV